MPDTQHCAECKAPLPSYWPRGLCAQCALNGALEMTNAVSQFLPAKTLAITQEDVKPAESAPDTSLPEAFGDYDLLDEIARGGMGVVYKARQRNLGRIVAVKMILAGPLAGKEFIWRFRTESAAAAVLQHPSIVAIHDVGVHEGRHYFSMDYVEGQNLAQLVGQRPLPPTKAARYVALIAAAIHYAHEHGILHRDLKPSNVLIDLDDQPRITDFGLAKRLDGDSSLTVSGQVLGSPNFMPPEQAGGWRGKAGRPSDVYALGGILYYLLTARAPFQAESLEGLITQVLNAEPVSPGLLNPSIPRDLETITLKCLQKEPSRRYQTAQELADELGRVLREEPIQARPVNSPEKLWRWCRRKPALASALGFAITVLLAGLATTSWQWRRAGRNAQSERRERTRAEAQAYASDMNLAQQALAMNNLGRASELLNRHRPAPNAGMKHTQPGTPHSGFSSTLDSQGSPDLRGWEWRYLWQQTQGDELFTLCQKPIAILSLAVSSDAPRSLAVAEENNGHLTLWDIQSRREILRLPEGEHPDVFYIRVAFSPTEPLLAYGSSSGFPPTNMVSRVRLWNLNTHRQVAELPLEFLCSGLAFSPDGRRLATSTINFLTLWDVRTGTKLRAYPFGSHAGSAVSFSVTPDFRLAAQASDNLQVRVVDLAAGKELWKTNTSANASVALSVNGRWLATAEAGEQSVIRICDALDGRSIIQFDSYPGGVIQLLFGPDDRTLISANTDQTIRIWDLSDLSSVPPPRTLIGHQLEVRGLALMPDGRTLASGGKDGSVRFWDLTRAPRQRGAIVLAGGPFAGWSFTESKPDLLTCDRKGKITRWSGESWQTTNVLIETGGDASSACFLPDRQEAVIAGRDDVLRVFKWTDSGPPRVLPSLPKKEYPRDWPWSLRRHGNGLAVGRFDQQVIQDYDLVTCELKDSWKAPGTLCTMDFSRDGRYCVMGGYRGQVLVRNMMTGEESSFVEDMPRIGTVGFSPQGDRVGISTDQGYVRWWETGSWRDVGRSGGFLHGVAGFSFSPDGQRFAAGSSGTEAIRFYDTERHQPLVTLGAEGADFTPAFDASGNVLAAFSRAGKLSVWRAPSWQEIEEKEKSTDH